MNMTFYLHYVPAQTKKYKHIVFLKAYISLQLLHIEEH